MASISTQINGPNGRNPTNGNKRRTESNLRESRGSPPIRLPSNTFKAQGDLPRLPIPSLNETLDKFVKTVFALQTPTERAETLELVEDFKKGNGPYLQQMLLDYEQEGVKSGKFGSYVEEFWNDSYLAPDSSVVLNLNPYFILEKGPDRKAAHDQLERAASLCFASLKMASLLKHETLPPDTFKGRPLCMDQFKVLFGSTRVPTMTGSKDFVHHFPDDSSHVVVLIRNHIYYFQALWPNDGSVAVDQNDIKDILEAIQKHVAYLETSGGNDDNASTYSPPAVGVNSSSGDALGVLTSLPRAEWAAARKMIMDGDNEKNKQALEIIDSALFVLVLDHNVPKDINDAAANMLHGTHELALGPQNTLVQVGSCCNRWYDKLQLIVMANGKAGVNFEHSAIDGHTALRYVSDVFAETVVQFAQSITALVYGKGWIPDNMQANVNRAHTTMSETINEGHNSKDHPVLDVFPKKLQFNLPHKVKEIIRFAESNLGDQIIASDTEVLEFTGYGKALIVKNSLSPDSLVQMSMMMAYYKLYGKFVCTYEPVLTKAFYHGRTEAMRGATPQAKKLCETWLNEKATKAEKLEALRVAAKEHSRLVRECANGKGVDRHLFALKSVAERNDVPLPKFFESDAWKLLNHTVISTSNCGNPSLRLFGFGPVVQDGFGVGYIIKDHGIQFSICSKHRQTKRYANMLENTLQDIKRLLNSSTSVVCGGHHNPVIRTGHHDKEVIAPKENEDDYYDDFWGESVLDGSTALKRNSFAETNAASEEEQQVTSRGFDQLFSNVLERRNSFHVDDIRKIGVQLSFDESVESTTGAAEDGRAWYFGSVHNPKTNGEEGSPPPSP